MFKKVLVANRGEIALRIIAACKELSLASVAVHSEVDSDALHVRAADESVCIGPAAPSGSYLNITSLVSAAEIATLHIREGRVMRVDPPPRLRQLAGVDRLFGLLDWNRGWFELAAVDVDAADELGVTTSQALIEHARRRDEASR